MREERKEVPQAEETSYFLHSSYETRFYGPFKWEKGRCVTYSFMSKAIFFQLHIATVLKV